MANTMVQECFSQIGERFDSITRLLKREIELPYESEIEYLESGTTQYIDTLINTNDVGNNGRFEIKIKLFNSRQRFMGYSRDMYGQQGDICLAIPDSKRTDIPYYYGGWNDSTITGFDCLQEEPYTIDFRFRSGSQELYIDGVLKKTTTKTWKDSTTEKHILVFRSFNDSGYLRRARVYFCKIYSGNILLRDYIPCRINTTGYLYDKVSNQLFGNVGTGNFILGPDK